MSSETVGEIDFPPGFAGQLTSFVYFASPRPVKEVAIAAVLGLLAGVCGRMFTVSNSGLNLYVVLVARSGIGKEGMHSGISKLMALVRDVPSANRFVDFDDFASGPALHKAILMNPCFVNVAGEWGRKLRVMANDKDGPLQTLRTVMTNTYQKSGPDDSLGGVKYSNGESSMVGVAGPAFSLLGETTPDTFYRALSSSMMEDGFLSRFTIVAHTGERPPPNELRAFELEPEELRRWRSLLVCSAPSQVPIGGHSRIEVQFDDEVKLKLDRFGLQCDSEINATTNEGRRQMWNRAHMKVLRIAALLAVADDPIAPRIDCEHAAWALTLVRRDIESMTVRMKSGDVGSDDHTRIDLVRAAVRSYFENVHVGSYGVKAGMQEKGIITYAFLQTRMRQKRAFSDHPLGSVKALETTLRALCDDGTLSETPSASVAKDFGFAGRCFTVQSLLDEGAE